MSSICLVLEGFSPLGYLPMLEVDGKKLNESMAIFRFAARESGKKIATSLKNILTI